MSHHSILTHERGKMGWKVIPWVKYLVHENADLSLISRTHIARLDGGACGLSTEEAQTGGALWLAGMRSKVNEGPCGRIIRWLRG